MARNEMEDKSRRLPGRESASQGQVESGEDSLRQVVTRFLRFVDSLQMCGVFLDRINRIDRIKR